MKLYKLEIEKEQLNSLPEKEVLFFVQIGVILKNQIQWSIQPLVRFKAKILNTQSCSLRPISFAKSLTLQSDYG